MPQDPESLPSQPKDRQEALIDNLYLGLPIQEAAKRAGYSKAYYKTTLYNTIKTPAFRDKFIERYKDHITLALPICLDTRLKALKMYQQEPGLAIEKPKLLESTERLLNLGADQVITQQTINYTQIQAILRGNLESKDTQDVVDDSVIDVIDGK